MIQTRAHSPLVTALIALSVAILVFYVTVQFAFAEQTCGMFAKDPTSTTTNTIAHGLAQSPTSVDVSVTWANSSQAYVGQGFWIASGSEQYSGWSIDNGSTVTTGNNTGKCVGVRDVNTSGRGIHADCSVTSTNIVFTWSQITYAWNAGGTVYVKWCADAPAVVSSTSGSSGAVSVDMSDSNEILVAMVIAVSCLVFVYGIHTTVEILRR